jgi:nucleoside-diphosphate-sugar epimerase
MSHRPEPETAFAMQRILLTGASGFIGSSLASRLLAEGHRLTLLGREFGTYPDGADHATADLAEPGSLKTALAALACREPFDTIIHLAVSRHHREFPARALDMFYVNSASAAELLHFAATTGVKRALFGSTGTVYSAVATPDGSQAGGNHESEFNRPTSYFAASKLFADAICELYRGLFPVAVLRFYAPYGPGLRERMLTDLANRVVEGRPISLPSQGPGLTFAATHVEDAIAVIMAAVDGEWNETVNVAAPEAWSIEAAGRLLGDLLGREVGFVRSNDRSAPYIVPDTSRLAELMRGHRFKLLREGLRDMLAADHHISQSASA